MISAGIDVGSKNIKVVLLDGNKIIGKAKKSSGEDQSQSISEALSDAVIDAKIKVEDIDKTGATGIGRKLFDADYSITSVTAGGRGIFEENNSIRTGIEVGAEEAKAIRINEKGRVTDSAVNEKCAAGSGSFVESMSRALGTTVESFSKLALNSTARIPMNAQCAVFAESEVVSLIAQDTPRKDISKAVHDSIASRISSMARRVKLESGIALFGGLALNPALVSALKNTLELDDLFIPEDPLYVCALGAAFLAKEKAEAEEKGD